MQKITFLISGFLFLVLGFVLIPFPLQAKEKNPNSLILFHSLEAKKCFQSIVQDKNLIRGNWQRDGTNIELHITKLLKNGGLEFSFSNSKLLFVEKAGWTDSSDVLRMFVIYRQEDKPGYSLSLNYDAEKDLLIGVYVDGLDNKSYNVIFRRIK